MGQGHRGRRLAGAVAAAALALVAVTAWSQTRERDGGRTRLSEEEFKAGVESGEIQVVTRQAMEGAALAARRRLERDRATVRFLLRDEPERLRELQRTPRPEPGVLEPLGDGYLLRRPDGSEVVLLGEAFKWASAADALAVSPSLPNQVQIFEGYEGLMGRDWASTFVPPGATLTLAERREVNQRASQAILDLYHPIEVEPIPRRIDCGQEQGVGNGTDGAMGMQFWPRFLGVGWPLRPHTTCVKDQGNRRGTCTAFAVTGAVEARRSAKYGDQWNFSEQALYDAAYRVWGGGSGFGDGLHPGDVLARAKGGSYRFLTESLWGYNPSWWASNQLAWSSVLSFTVERPGSCTGYSSWCSNFLHQAQTVFLKGGSFWGFMSPALAGGGPRVQGFTVLDTDLGGQSIAKAYLSLSVPVVLWVQVDDRFAAAGGAAMPGIVEVAAGSPFRGEHAVLAVGFVDNASLPAGKPPGQGGGYLVVKNSWGTTWGDQGYAYLSYEWVRRKGRVMYAVWDVS